MQTMRYKKMYPAILGFTAFLFVTGLVLGDPRTILPGLWKIMMTEDALITDYIRIAGIGAAFVNSALVTLISVVILYLAKDPLNGYTIVEIGLMSGFALFGKNFINIWPIIGGTFLYAKLRREPFGSYASVSLLATALAPVVSYIALDNGWGNPAIGILVGALIGFLLPALSSYTYKIQNGMNLYNMGFACGLLAMILVPVMNALGADLETAYFWATGYNLKLGIVLGLLCTLMIVTGLFFCNRPVWAAWAGYRRLLQTTGRAPSDYLRMFGPAAVLINMGIDGLIGMAFILLTGGDLNGPTLGGIFTVMGFSAYGKHARNIIPVMGGVVLGSIFMKFNINDSAVQLALLFGTTLAPVSGCFGWPFGLAAGFLHSAVVLSTSGPVAGINLYNNGFSGGIIAIVVYPVVMAAIRHLKPELQDEDYFEAFEEDAPITPPPTDKS